jgi:hypothetical protein
MHVPKVAKFSFPLEKVGVENPGVTRVTRLGYGIRPKMAKSGVLFSKVVLKRVLFRKYLTNHVKRVHFEQSELENGTISTPCHNSKRV